jgi:SAM-dependent methyltransferase
MKNQAISRHFEFYKKVKENDFFLKGGRRIDSLMLKNYKDQKLVAGKTDYVHVNGEKTARPIVTTIIEDSFVERLNPDNIDSCHFWKKAVEVAPMASIAFSIGKRNVAELNERSLKENHMVCNAIAELDKVFKENPAAKILEIGPGYGCVRDYIKKEYSIKNYYAIDVNPLFMSKRVFKTDGKTIPSEIPDNLDVVYSVNVFQHLSPNQRMSYYEQIKQKLAPGGKFIFSMFVADEEVLQRIYANKDGSLFRLFGMKDTKGNYYTNFFSQLTKCNTTEELKNTFSTLDMDFEIFFKNNHSFYMCVTKK